MKQTYEKPRTELYLLEPKGSLLYGSAEKMNTVAGSWDEDPENQSDF